ncbi:hypothetical protein [Virgibacillus alimentarius]|uniref:Uncharacterized protein n=1 Tax=Virgibacillus alimentarius TaxID=698769 RepID=A0ABS4S9X5_9BACI|nr:hypothetical protein [Virgibacillus alimentarius]MBP2257896.1 hypothetical protein [Virgibacillus alimentarius]
MNGKEEKYEYSDDEILEEAIELVKKGSTYEEVQRKFNLSGDDINLIDFVINEF